MSTAIVFIVIGLAAFLIAGLTFFSGFGLGTLLMPVFALFFDLPTAIAATAVVHLANNLFKAGLVRREADWAVALRFGLPAALAAVVGAWLLALASGLAPLLSYELWGREAVVTPIKSLVGFLILVFAVIEVHPRFDKLAFARKWLPLGGVISGFFGGLSGHQGALRGAFLIKSGLSKGSFVATSALCAVVVDLSRLMVYGAGFYSRHLDLIASGSEALQIAFGCLSAFIGTFLGRRFLSKVTMKTVQGVVGSMLILIALLLLAGLL